ncbi:MAG: threonine--tRNA ligase [Candidatus Gracilibacteria bacterium]|nr:threonine--tRNA ligase [Candidatus Gracilibacteria bacterium]
MKHEINVIRHSLSHVMAQAVKSIYGEDVKLAIGPDIENGFYYDFDFNGIEFKEENLKEVEKKMKNIIKQNQKFEAYKLPVAEAIAKLEAKGELYKVEMIKDLQTAGETEIGFYKNVTQQGIETFEDMCRGPHVDQTLDIDENAFKLDKIAGAYWKGDEKNKMLTRIYAFAFENREKLDEHIKMLEEARKRDHRIIGQKMELYSFSENVGLGLPLWHPMGMRLWREIEDFWLEEHKKEGYEFVKSPHIGNKKLWQTSGHWGFYADSMYPPLEVGQSLEEAQSGVKAKESEIYLLKPMNCPFHVEIYNAVPKSYRELPLRWAETGTVYRFEKKGQLGGLTRVRGFTQDDAHIICRKDQMKDEIVRVFNFITSVLSTFGFKEYGIYLSFRDPENKEKYVGDPKMWEFSQNVLKEIVKEKGVKATIEEGEAAFYGPKIDFKIKDCLGREHQCSTVQFDFNLPERFNMTFKNSNGEDEQPYMIHRVLLGSFERFIGVLIEHYAGIFPLWLTPRQVVVVPVGENFNDYADKVYAELKDAGLRVEVDDSSDSLNKKVRNAEQSHINYILVVGEQEQKDSGVAVRNYKTKEQSNEKLGEFISRIKEEIVEKKL